MLRKLMAVTATAAMLGAIVAAYAITSVRASDENPPRVDGRTILPSIPEPPEPAPVARKVSPKPSAGKSSATKPKYAKAKPRAAGKARTATTARTQKTKPARKKAKR
jgi:hypothetical protein